MTRMLYPVRLILADICEEKCPLFSSLSLAITKAVSLFASSIWNIFLITSNRPKQNVRGILTVFTVFIFLFQASGQSYQSDIKWMPLEEALALQKDNPRKMLIEVYTQWCKVCHKLDQLSLSQEYIADYINENFYPVKFDAESKAPIYFMGQKYEFNNDGSSGYHEFAFKITHGKLNYPSLVFMDEDLRVIQSINGFQSPSKLIRILTYFADNYNKKIPWNEFNSRYNSLIHQSGASNQ